MLLLFTLVIVFADFGLHGIKAQGGSIKALRSSTIQRDGKFDFLKIFIYCMEVFKVVGVTLFSVIKENWRCLATPVGLNAAKKTLKNFKSCFLSVPQKYIQ